LGKALLLQVDVTANSEADKAFLKNFGLYGPPAILFFDAKGSEIGDIRVVGYQDSAQFLTSLQAANL
jgi:thiol:disulfide interchange protein DsbD